MTVIAFDGACFGDGPPTGVARAFTTALGAYVEHERGDDECVLLLPPHASPPPELTDLAALRHVAAPRGRLRRQLRLPRLLHELGCGLLHSSVASVPLTTTCATIATAHDLPWFWPESGERSTRWQRLATTSALRAATRVLAPSTATAMDVARLLGRDTSVRLVPHATPAPATVPAPTTRNGPLLALGDDRPRKNRARLQRSHAAATSRCPTLPPLSFVGPPDAFVDEATKLRLLRDCRALVHVTRFEGFGLPVLEGLAHGAPVLCSDLAPHREIAGPCALFVDPHDECAIADAMIRIHSDAQLRANLAAAGRARAAAFTPHATAAAWRRVHREVLA